MKRKVLLNPGPATTTDTVKMAQIVSDICPREKEFTAMLSQIRSDLVKIVHGDPQKYTSVLFCGSGTIAMDICLNSLIPDGLKILIINNGAYSQRALDICNFYNLPFIELKFPYDERPDLQKIEEALKINKDIGLVYTTHNETGTGLLNPIREVGALAHKYHATFVVDTTSTFAMLPINLEQDHVDFCMASSQKGLMSMTGLTFVVGSRQKIEESRFYKRRSYYCNLYLQYEYFEKTGEMHFTPPVQTVYSVEQALKEYFNEGEQEKYKRHISVFQELQKGVQALGFKEIIKKEWQSGLIVSVLYPDDHNWDFEKIHDYCYEKGYTIYPGKIDNMNTFRLCALGAITPEDIKGFFHCFEKGLKEMNVTIPIKYCQES